ncbi:hypothetical protein GCM10027569_46670 [Flindersiella endophytica]
MLAWVRGVGLLSGIGLLPGVRLLAGIPPLRRTRRRVLLTRILLLTWVRLLPAARRLLLLIGAGLRLVRILLRLARRLLVRLRLLGLWLLWLLRLRLPRVLLRLLRLRLGLPGLRLLRLLWLRLRRPARHPPAGLGRAGRPLPPTLAGLIGAGPVLRLVWHACRPGWFPIRVRARRRAPLMTCHVNPSDTRRARQPRRGARERSAQP